MSFAETDLRAVLEEGSAAPPANPDRYGEVRRRVRRVTARRTAGAACMVAFVVALAGAGIAVPFGGDRNAVTPTSGIAPGSEGITLLPDTLEGLPLTYAAQFDLKDKHRAQLKFVPKNGNYLIAVVCESADRTIFMRARVAGATDHPLDGWSGGGCRAGHPGGHSVGAAGWRHPGQSVTLDVAIFPSEIVSLDTIRSNEERIRLLTSAPWPDGAQRDGSWAVGVYGADSAEPDTKGSGVATWDLSGTDMRAVDTPSRPVTLLPEKYLGGARQSGQQYPADGKVRRLTFVPKTPTTGLTFACPGEEDVWYVQRLPNGHFVLPQGCESKGPQGLDGWAGADAWPHNDPGEPLTVEVAAFPASIPMPKTKKELARLLSNPPAANGVEWAIGAYDVSADSP